MDTPLPTAYHCPFCPGQLVQFSSGNSEYDLSCAACEAGFRVEGQVVHSRRWDRLAARGLHQAFALAEISQPFSGGQP